MLDRLKDKYPKFGTRGRYLAGEVISTLSQIPRGKLPELEAALEIEFAAHKNEGRDEDEFTDSAISRVAALEEKWQEDFAHPEVPIKKKDSATTKSVQYLNELLAFDKISIEAEKEYKIDFIRPDAHFSGIQNIKFSKEAAAFLNENKSSEHTGHDWLNVMCMGIARSEGQSGFKYIHDKHGSSIARLYDFEVKLQKSHQNMRLGVFMRDNTFYISAPFVHK